jgi:hypothetical protein
MASIMQDIGYLDHESSLASRQKMLDQHEKKVTEKVTKKVTEMVTKKVTEMVAKELTVQKERELAQKERELTVQKERELAQKDRESAKKLLALGSFTFSDQFYLSKFGRTGC